MVYLPKTSVTQIQTNHLMIQSWIKGTALGGKTGFTGKYIFIYQFLLLLFFFFACFQQTETNLQTLLFTYYNVVITGWEKNGKIKQIHDK